MFRPHRALLCGFGVAVAGGCALRAPPAVSGHGPEAPGDDTAVAYSSLSDADPRLSGRDLSEEHDRTLLATEVCAAEPERKRARASESARGVASYSGAEWERAMNGAAPEPFFEGQTDGDGPSALTVWREMTAAAALDTQPRAFDRVSVVPVVASQEPESPLPTNLYLRDPGWGPPTSGASNW